MAKPKKKPSPAVIDKVKEEMAEEVKTIEEQVRGELKEEVEQVEKVEEKSLVVRSKPGRKFVLILLVVILLALIPAVYFYYQYQTAKDLLQGSASSGNQTQALIDKVGKLILLPTGEQPRTATVTDITQLAGQPFFKNAKDGDKVLIYTQAGEAILYRESINKIIAVSPVSTGIGSGQIPAVATPTPAVQRATVTVLNGTQTVGLAKAAVTKIKSSLPNITVSGTADALSGGYTSTVVVDVSGDKQQAAGQIVNLLGGRIESSIPQGEASPSSDILVILGSNYVK